MGLSAECSFNVVVCRWSKQSFQSVALNISKNPCLHRLPSCLFGGRFVILHCLSQRAVWKTFGKGEKPKFNHLIMSSNKTKGAIYGCISAVSYGLNPLCAKALYAEGVNTNTVLFYRFAFGVAILGLMMLASRQSFRLTRREGLVLTLLGALFAFSSITYFISFHYLSAGVAATLVFAYPVMVAIIMALFFRERLGWPSLLAIALTVGGIALLYQGDDGKPISLPGFVIVMVSALAYALYIVVVNRSKIVMSSVKLTFYAMLVCLLCIALFSLIDRQPLTLLQSPTEWIYAALLGLVPTVVSLVYMAKAIHLIGSTPTAIMGALEPVTAVVAGMLMFGEVLTLRLSFGIALILLAVMFVITSSTLQRRLAIGQVVRRAERLVLKRWRWR